MLDTFEFAMEMVEQDIVNELSYNTMGKTYKKAAKGYANAAKDGRTNDALRYSRIASRAHQGILNKAARNGHVKTAHTVGKGAIGLGKLAKATLGTGALTLGVTAIKKAKDYYTKNKDTETDKVPEKESNHPTNPSTTKEAWYY